MALDARRAADDLEARLAALGTPERAEHERRYLKSELEHLGATVWQIRRQVRAFTKQHADLTHAELMQLVEELWARPVHERRMAAVVALEDFPAHIGPADLPLLERLVRESRTWALVDGLAAHVLGELLVRHPGAAPKLDRWAKDPDLWVRRSALLAQLEPLRAGAPFARFGRYADWMLDEPEFFIRKAIGWVLRETGKTRPAEVFQWLAPRAGRASGVTMREAVKYLPPEQRAALMP
ncbi:MAG TPA: DNA alkylation repair protein [Gaiellaceae bacterium]|nr:DNA alkylation repair protein [Gaiellaceae bacterium]